MTKITWFIFLVSINCIDFLRAQKKVVCYYGSWAVYRPGNGKFLVEDIDPLKCTHLIYAFAGVQPDGFIQSLDPWNDISLQGYIRFNNLKLQNPNLKTLIAVGGWNEGSEKYSNIANNAVYRQNFISSSINFINTYNFDGIDIDWEYPGQRGGQPYDRNNFVTLLQEFRSAIGTRLLTIAAGASPTTVDISYDVPQISAVVDFINVMTYDLHGPWEPITGANAPLSLTSAPVTNPHTVISCLSYWISQGAPRSKLILGIPAYGHTFTLSNINQNGVGAPAVGAGSPGPYTREAGMLGYNEILEYLQIPNLWTKVWDNEQQVPYMYNGNQWVSYDDEQSVEIKTAYARDQNFGGVMVWSIETDPVKGVANKNPLLNKILATL